MANPYYALRRIRRARSSLPSPPSSQFETHRDEYETILRAIHDLAGGDAVDDISGWIIVQTAHDQTLPTPQVVRRRALSLLRARDVAVPEESPLRRS
ncbi:hypothetical protein [Halorubrum vacuolatum]|uniref:Uncharacterized protein n=1 Tax=Halorubrum vacuolatum TaxID=63740 RepID=A0A238WFJ8_HALVU|nr:hypothetical protein [Halorubrum vacuolatum]SNR44459.1 hypothetical protein SAMN06264855_10738 [Halorubrum vacuolatum]